MRILAAILRAISVTLAPFGLLILVWWATGDRGQR